MLYHLSGVVVGRCPLVIAAAAGLTGCVILSSSGCSALPRVSVPRLVGKQETAAKSELHQLGLGVKIIWQGHSSPVPPRPKSVLLQRPAAGQKVQPHSVVTLIVRL